MVRPYFPCSLGAARGKVGRCPAIRHPTFIGFLLKCFEWSHFNRGEDGILLVMHEDAKEEVRAKLNIEDVIGEYVPLKRAGRNWKGLSPFTNEKTPSFVVSPDKQIWHDFSSNKGGDIYSFVMEVEGLDFPAVLELLARKAGVDLSLYKRSSGTSLTKRKARLLSALDGAAHYYQHSLIRNKHALQYVLGRRLNKQTINDFRIGYAPAAERGLINYLLKKGFNIYELRDAGLVGSRGERDMFRGRMMVPLMDGQGQVIGFTARLIDDTPGVPKYINTPQTILYDKSRHVFGLHLAKEAIRKADYAVVAEGNMDVIASHQAGCRQVVATAGTALTEYHLKALSRLTGNIRLAFDADAAGIAATERAIGIAEAAGVRLSIIALPGGSKDPDEAIQKDPKLWQEAIERAVYALDWLIAQYAERFDPTSVDGKREITNRALTVIKQLPDPVEQEHYIQLLSRTTGASVEAIERKLAGTTGDPVKRLKPITAPLVGKDTFAYQDSLLALTAAYPETRSVLKGALSAGFRGEQRQRIGSYIFMLENNPIPDRLPHSLQSDDTYVKILLLKAEDRYAAWDSQDRYVEAAKLARDVINEQKRNRKKELIKELRQAETKGDTTLVSQLIGELNNLIKERS